MCSSSPVNSEEEGGEQTWFDWMVNGAQTLLEEMDPKEHVAPSFYCGIQKCEIGRADVGKEDAIAPY